MLCIARRYLFDHLLVLPEYLVEFQYTLGSQSSCLAARPLLSMEDDGPKVRGLPP